MRCLTDAASFFASVARPLRGTLFSAGV